MVKNLFLKKNIYILGFLLLFFTGCSVTSQVLGEYHLQNKSYDEGYSHFKKELTENETASNHYYYARFLIAKDKFKEAITSLKKAIKLDKDKSIYYSWLGVAYGNIKEYKEERKAYLKALSLDEKNEQALIYLAHNYFEKKDYNNALKYYKKVLKITPSNQFALYNRSLCLEKLRRTPEVILSLKEYLEYYPSGLLAKKATEKLNSLGDFSFRNHLIGFKTITLRDIEFEPFSAEISSKSYSSLDVLGRVLEENKKISIHIIAYQLNNKNLAKEKVKSIKTYLLKNYGEINTNRLKLSWFDTSKKIKIKKNLYKLDENIDFITYIKK